MGAGLLRVAARAGGASACKRADLKLSSSTNNLMHPANLSDPLKATLSPYRNDPSRHGRQHKLEGKTMNELAVILLALILAAVR